jgi:hypothetical protein
MAVFATSSLDILFFYDHYAVKIPKKLVLYFSSALYFSLSLMYASYDETCVVSMWLFLLQRACHVKEESNYDHFSYSFLKLTMLIVKKKYQ